jgi:hypothetical protein
VVAAHQDDHHPPSVDDHRHRLQQRARGGVERRGHLLNRGQPGGRDLLRCVHGRRKLDRLRLRGGDLHVGRVAGCDRNLVLACGAGRHVLVRPQPSHHPHVALDPVPAQAAAVEDPVVGLDMAGIAVLQPLDIAVEAVGVLHHELARAQHTGPRPRLVALLGLQVVEDLRQLAVGADLTRDVEGDVLLVRHREHQLGPLAVLELEQLLDLVATRLAPELGGLHDRHQHLLAADRVHLLADDPLDLAMGPPAGGKKGPEARRDLADQPRPHHQLVRVRLRVGRSLLEGGPEKLRHARHGVVR